MNAKAFQTAFHREGRVLVRPIVIPTEDIESISAADLPEGGTVMDAILERAFYYGQNDFQPIPNRYSVSVGDVIEIPSSMAFLGRRHFRVLGAGFQELEIGADPEALTGREAQQALRIGGETRMFWIKVTHSEINGQPMKCVAAGDRELEVAVPCGGQRAAIYKMVARQDNRPFLPLPVKVKGE
jgi:hypothetical protein